MPVLFGKGLTPQPADLVDDPKEDFLGSFLPIGAMGGGVADVAPGDVGRAVVGEGDAVRQLPTPSCWFCVRTLWTWRKPMEKSITYLRRTTGDCPMPLRMRRRGSISSGALSRLRSRPYPLRSTPT